VGENPSAATYVRKTFARPIGPTEGQVEEATALADRDQPEAHA